MLSKIVALKNRIKKSLIIFPVLLSVCLGLYFMNLFERIDVVNYKRQVLQRNAFVEFASFIDSKFELYTYLDLFDSLEDSSIFLLDDNFEIPKDKRHAANCVYALNSNDHPFQKDEFKKLMKKAKNGTFTHQIDDHTKIDFNYKYITIEDRTYILLVGVHKYPMTSEEFELEWAIGFLLLFTALTNYLLVMYAKHVRFLQLRYNAKRK